MHGLRALALAATSLSLFARSSGNAAGPGPDRADLTTAQLTARANVLLSSGDAPAALVLYDAALSRDPSDYLTVYKKAATHLSLGHIKAAAEAFERVLELSEYDAARLQLAKIALRTGEWEKGELQVGKYAKAKGKDDAEGKKVWGQLKEGKQRLRKAVEAKGKGKWEECLNEATEALQLSAQSLELRLLRSDCHLGLVHVDDAVADLTRAAQISPNSPTLSLRLSYLSSLFLSHPPAQSLAPLRQCLHSDPESKPCKKAFRQLKALDKDLSKARNFIEASSFRLAISILDPPRKPGEGILDQVKEAIKQAQEGGEAALVPATLGESYSELYKTLLSWTCRSHVRLSQLALSRPSCSLLLSISPDNIDALVGEGEQLYKEEKWEDAVRVLSKAFEHGGRQDKDVGRRLQKAQTALKVSKQKDYYKILGVPRDADDRTLKKAYRRASLKAHPDKGGSEAQMQALNEAYELLSNPETRRQIDNGEDPLDYSQQQRQPFVFQQGPGFQQFFQQGGFPGGGQTFSFRFGG